jgi:hypothetical protein
MRRFSPCRFFDPESESVFYCGLDLGQPKDYTAWSVIERRPGIPALYHIRSLKRFELGTSYPSIVKQVRGAVDNPAIKPNLLLIDNTGVRRAISDLFRQEGLHFYPITITGGDKAYRDGRSINIPKRDLVSTIQVLLQTKRLKIPAALPEAQVLLEEMTNFQVKISQTGHDSYGAWREGTHDDLLLAVALACLAAEKRELPKGLHWPRVKTGRRPIYAHGISRLSRLPQILNGLNSGFLTGWIGKKD